MKSGHRVHNVLLVPAACTTSPTVTVTPPFLLTDAVSTSTIIHSLHGMQCKTLIPVPLEWE